MLTLDHHLKLDKETIEAPNLCDRFSDQDLQRIGLYVYEHYKADLQSREPWLRRTSAAMDLAMQVQKDKNFPWPGCSNIAFPLVTVAALQFHSKAYPALVPNPDLVNARVIGPDPDGMKTKRAERIATHMSWQLLEQDETWEEQQDRALLIAPIVGTAWKKSYYDASKGHNVSDVILPRDLVVNYWGKTIEDCAVKTHVIPLTRNMMHSRIVEGTYRDVRDCEWYKGDAPIPPITQESTDSDNRIGMTMPQPDERSPFVGLEQHCSLDLDGDGYEEPYVVTLEESSQDVLRIVCRFDREEDIIRNRDTKEIIRINAVEYFTKIPFIPSPDGGIMDIGFGTLLGPLNESTNSAMNQLFDAGTMANTAGGFLGRGAKIRGGVYDFSPFKWNRVDSTGDDLKKSIYPLPVREPSNVMFQVLSLLIEYTEKISGAVDITTGGNPGQNTPAETSQSMIEQGQKVYAAIFKRMWRSFKSELKKLYQLNGLHLPVSGKIYFAGSDKYITREDYTSDPSSVVPVADPNVMSDRARLGQAQTLIAVAKGNPLYDQDECNKVFLKAIRIPNVDQVYLGTKRMPQPKPTEKVQIELIKQQIANSKMEWQKLQFMASIFEQRRLNEAKIVQLEAAAALALAQTGGEKSGQELMKFQAQIDALKTVSQMHSDLIDQLNEAGELNGQDQQTGSNGSPGANSSGAVPAMAGPSSNSTTP